MTSLWRPPARRMLRVVYRLITSFLANTDATALNSLAELLAGYSQNGSGVTAALTAAVVRIAQLEATVAEPSRAPQAATAQAMPPEKPD